MGTELSARRVDTSLPLWSARALIDAPEVVGAIHQAYVEAGATVHTSNTFRTRRRTASERWEELTRLAVAVARQALPPGQRLAGSLAPLEDCYRPDLSPPDPRPEHREMAGVLADAGCDLILCETFPHVGEALVAVEEAVATGRETWLALTAGPRGDLLTPEALGAGALEAVRRGASAVLVNCVPAAATLPFVRRLAVAGVPFGAYANAGGPEKRIGWQSVADPEGAARYLVHARTWVAEGATLIGACCGTGPAHVCALVEAFGGS